MTDIVNVKYESTQKSLKTDELGMREMQARAYRSRESQYLLLKAPPASGKSRALMFIALDKLKNKRVNKVIVAVPERSIASSFSETVLKLHGFHSDWSPGSYFDLCAPGGGASKVIKFKEFMRSSEQILICTHATLRFAFQQLNASDFNQCLLAIDEFHHVSAENENRLGELIREIMSYSNAHILAMTGSYFRGDGIPVLMPEDERKFFRVTYNYYEQLNGYKYLKSLGIGYHFYKGAYTSAISKVLDTDKKTILHIPSPNSGESTKDKLREVDCILDSIGFVKKVDPINKIIHVERKDGRVIKVADLVDDTSPDRDKTLSFLREIKSEDDVDIIIALGMAKEGFDWPYCEHALTVGYRGSLTEIIQIIGRCTRDSPNKTHAQFTNLIAEPEADGSEVIQSVNNMLKAITASLLMEQVLAPNFDFKSKKDGSEKTIAIKGYQKTKSSKVQNIIDTDLTDLKASILQHPEIIHALPGKVDPEIINKVLIPKVVKLKYPDLSADEANDVSQYIVIDSVLKHSQVEQKGNKKFIKLANDFINIDEIDLDLINTINPFQNAFEVLSKTLTPRVLKAVQQSINAFKISMTDDEAFYLWPKVNEFVRRMGRHPSLDAIDPQEKRLAEAIVYLKEIKRQSQND